MILRIATLMCLASSCFAEILEAGKAAEISREIREQFRKSGMQWHSPKMLREVRTWSYHAMHHASLRI